MRPSTRTASERTSSTTAAATDRIVTLAPAARAESRVNIGRPPPTLPRDLGQPANREQRPVVALPCEARSHGPRWQRCRARGATSRAPRHRGVPATAVVVEHEPRREGRDVLRGFGLLDPVSARQATAARRASCTHRRRRSSRRAARGSARSSARPSPQDRAPSRPWFGRSPAPRRRRRRGRWPRCARATGPRAGTTRRARTRRRVAAPPRWPHHAGRRCRARTMRTSSATRPPVLSTVTAPRTAPLPDASSRLRTAAA